MRILRELKRFADQPQQCLLFKDDKYTYRIFCTSLAGFAHQVIAEYDKRADVEKLVGQAKRGGLDMIPSAKFKNNYSFFLIVMQAYNIWRYRLRIEWGNYASVSQGEVHSIICSDPRHCL